MVGVLKDLDNPHQKLKGFHIAGTNGKGSVCATLEALCLAHGLSTGLNTSPHLVRYTERFRLQGQEISYEELLALFNENQALFDKWEASFFEISTALAFLLFYRNKVDAAIMEVGLGGRLDATNLFVPDISAINTIALDHTKTLGNSLKIIALEKAGIVKPEIPLVLGEISSIPYKVIEEVAMSKAAPLYRFGKEWAVSAVLNKLGGTCFSYRFGDTFYNRLDSNMMGSHQANNIGLALTAFLLFCQKHHIEVEEDKVRRALIGINWAGRMQLIGTKPALIIDGAHNVQGVKALMNSLEKLYPNQKLYFILSILADKDFPQMISLFSKKAKKVFVAQNNSDRAASADIQLKELNKHSVEAVACASVKEALKLALNEAKEDDVIIAGGSLFTVGEIIDAHKEYA